MAGILVSANTAEVALTAATLKTVIQVVAPTNQRLKVLRWGIFFDGTSAVNEPVRVRLLRQTTSGSMTSLTPVRLGVGSESLQATAQHTATGTEPTAGDVLDTVEVHPQAGFESVFPFGSEILIPGGGRLGIDCLATDAVNCIAKIVYEE
jgi:hypothetical protein